MSLRCSRCEAHTAETLQTAVCPACAGALLWEPAAGESARTVTLGEGDTPVISLARWTARHGLPAVWVKLEHLQPTGSFKDRGSAMLLSRVLALGAKRLVEDSSGNAGASMAAYAARAGLSCTVYAPAAAPPAKLNAVLTAGAELRRVAGSREDVAAAARQDNREGAYYAGHNTNPYFLHGMRSFADEVVQQFNGEPPEHIVMPVGGGSLYVGAWLGFQAARAAGQIARLPRLHIAQAAGCAPLVEAQRQGAGDAVAVTRTPTVASGITIERPARGPLILRALRESGGMAVAVSEEAILRVRRELATVEGLDVEPTSAVAFAALLSLREQGVPRDGERVVLPVSGAGWKDPMNTSEEASA